LAALRQQEAVAAAHELGVPSYRVHFLGFSDGMLHTVQDEAIAAVTPLLAEIQPAQIFVPSPKEPPSDHFMTHAAVMAALKAAPFAVTIYEYPVWYWFHWPWVNLLQNRRRDTRVALKTSALTWFGLRLLPEFQVGIDISDVLAQKQVALAQHRSQMESLQPDAGWLTLHDVADGDFLYCFFQEVELFRRYHMQASR
ncbi:MAG: PIG-L family deacetylase, partial [Anaerolineae bacterium]|nr:PIG-L family deacetylase [Anaerolineae bacterium]